MSTSDGVWVMTLPSQGGGRYVHAVFASEALAEAWTADSPRACAGAQWESFAIHVDGEPLVPHGDLGGDDLVAHLAAEHDIRFMPSDVRENPERVVATHREQHPHVTSPHRSDRGALR